MSTRKRKNAFLSISSSSSDDDDDDEDDDEDEEEDDEDDTDDCDDEDDYDDEDERDANIISSSEEGIELSEEESDRESIDDASESDPAYESNCDRVIGLLQGGRDLHVLKLEECKAYLRKHGLRLTGTKEICMQRIQEHWRIKDGNGEKLYPRSSFTINCTGDVCQGDVVLFTQRIYKKFDVVTRGGKPIGKRTITGRVVKESYGAAKQQHTFTVEILWSKGLKTLPPLFPLLVKGRNLYRLKTFRQRWNDEAERLKVLSEKHKRGAVARHIRATKKARSSNGGSKLQKLSRRKETTQKRRRNPETECSTKAHKQVVSYGGAPSSGQVKTKGTAKLRNHEQSGSKRKRQSCMTRTPIKKQRNQEPLTTVGTQKPNSRHVKGLESSARPTLHAHRHRNGVHMHHPFNGPFQNNYQAQMPYHYRDISPAYAASGRVYPFSKYELGSSSTAAGVSRNRMDAPTLNRQAFNDNNYFSHAGFDPRFSSHLPTQVHIDRQLNAVPRVVQTQVHKNGQLPCSTPGCKDMGAKSCIGSFCWRCCRSKGRKCHKHKLP